MKGRRRRPEGASSPEDSATARTRAKALNGAGALAMYQGDYGAAKAFSEEGLALYRELEDVEGVASCLTYLGFTAMLGQRDDIPVADILEEALGLMPRLENRRTIAHVLVLAGVFAGLVRHDWVEATDLHEEALASFREIKDAQGACICLYNLGLISVIRGDPVRASALLRELMRLARELDNPFNSLHAFFGLAGVAAAVDQAARAVRLWGVAEALQDAYDMHIAPTAYAAVNYEDRLSEARAGLGKAAFEEAWAEGKTMPLEVAVGYALAEQEERAPAPAEPSSGVRPAVLTRREVEISSFVARGLTNRRIAEELSISERTVDTHVTRILKKLGLRSRAQVAAWSSERAAR